jgi:hypothetical protein
MSYHRPMRARSLVLCGLFAVACDPAPARLPPDGLPYPRPAPDAGAEPAHDARPPVEHDAAAHDAAPADATPLDAAADAGLDAVASDAAVSEAAPADAAPADAAPLPPVPRAAEVAVAATPDRAWVAWYGGHGLRLRALDANGEWTGPATDLAPLDGPPAGVAAAVVGGVPWIAYAAGDDAPVRLVRADTPEAGGPELELRGAPLLTAAGDALLVVARAPVAGGTALGWQRVIHEDQGWSARPPSTEPGPLPAPRDAVPLGSGALVRFDRDGECLQIDGDAAAVGFLPCLAAPGRLASDGRLPVVVHRHEPVHDDGTLGQAYVRVTPVLGDGPRDLAAIAALLPDGTFGDFPAVNGVVPIAAIGNQRGSTRDGHVFVALVAADTLQVSHDGLLEGLPAGTRAVVPRGAKAVLLSFGTADDPVRTPLDMDPPEAGDYVATLADGCTPRAEACDGEDNDCDGAVDDGLCCPTADPDHAAITADGRPTDLLVSDSSLRNRTNFALRGADGHWHVYAAAFSPPAVTRYDAFDVEAGPGRALVATGGNFLLLTDGGGQVHATWLGTAARPRRKDPQDLPCDRILAAATLQADGDQASALVVCPNEFRVMFPSADLPDRTYDFDMLGIPSADWATVVRNGASDVVLFSFTSDFPGHPHIPQLAVVTNDGPTLQGSLPAHLPPDGADWAAPVYARPPEYWPAFQPPADRPARAWLHGDADTAWRLVIAGERSDRFAYAPATGKVYASARLPDALGIWTVDASDFGAPSLWSRDPAYRIPDADALWALQPGNYNPEILAVGMGPDGLTAWFPRVDCHDVTY